MGPVSEGPPGRDLARLPKAHLHLHFTGSLRHSTLLELAADHGIALPDALTREWPPRLHATDERGWFRFQRLYDTARSVVRDEAAVRRLLLEAAEDERAEGSRWLEIQVDPTSYAPRLGGLTPTVELVLDAAREASAATGVGVGVVIAANRTRHPLESRTLARLAAQYAGQGVVGFGLSNDERRGRPEHFERAFAIARRAGLISVPHAGELAGPASVTASLQCLDAFRIGHGVRSAEDPRVLEVLARRGTTLEVCPSSNVALGVYARAADVPLRRLYDAGIGIALGADDPVLFGSRLVDQYEIARHAHGFADADLAELARQSLRGSTAPENIVRAAFTAIDGWLAQPA